MEYQVISQFQDNDPGKTVYNVGDSYHNDDHIRIEQLLGNNRYKRPFIAFNKAVADAERECKIAWQEAESADKLQTEPPKAVKRPNRNKHQRKNDV